MKTVAIFGSGMMPPAIIDYYSHKYPCQIIIATIDRPQAEKLIAGKENCQIAMWSADDPNSIDAITAKADLVAAMIPEHVLLPVAESCIRTATPMVYTAYNEVNIQKLSEKAQEKGILILSEVGEDPGLDHLCAMKILEDIRAENGKVLEVKQWGAGIPDHADNNNPMGYKFSWSPPRLYEALQASPTYTVNGEQISYHNGEQYKHFKLVDTLWGTFESVAHRTVMPYFDAYQLPKNISYIRGLLRHHGYCNTVNAYLKLGLLNSKQPFDYQGKSCREITASLIDAEPENLEQAMADFLEMKTYDDIMHRLKWLGLFKDSPAPIEQGTPAQYLLALQSRRMMYAEHESDITLILARITVELANGQRVLKEGRLRVAGIPGGFSAMSRAVGYSVGVAGRKILEGKVPQTGCLMLPELPDLCHLMRDEMAQYQFKFDYETFEQ